MTKSASLVTCTIDLSASGKQAGFLRVPHSTHDSAYGWIGVPIVCLSGGPGPTVMMTAGVHGDEYEGQIALTRLARGLDAADIKGRLVLLPAVNAPAADAGRRVSPLDQGNLNRVFPGDPHGTPTDMIAHCLETVLIPQADALVDLHSGGTSLRYPATLLRGPGANAAEAARLDRLQEAFDLPWAWVFGSSPGRASAGRTAMAAANRAGVPCVMAELGGGGAADLAILERTMRGLRRILAAEGLIEESLSAPQGTRAVRALGSIYAEDEGVFEPLKTIGDAVSAGEPVARIHEPRHPLRPPVTVASPWSGIVLAERALARVTLGDALYQIAEDV